MYFTRVQLALEGPTFRMLLCLEFRLTSQRTFTACAREAEQGMIKKIHLSSKLWSDAESQPPELLGGHQTASVACFVTETGEFLLIAPL